MKDFTEWFNENFSRPEAILVEYLDELQTCAAKVGGLLPPDFIQRLAIASSPTSKRDYLYLPSSTGIADTKQSAYAFMGTTDYKGCSVPVPIVVFRSFKLSIPSVTFAPSSYLVKAFRANRSISSSYGRRSDMSYNEAVEKLKAEGEAKQKALETQMKKANAAAADLASAQLRKCFISTVENPSAAFGIEGLSQNTVSEFICLKGVSDMLYFQSRKCWKQHQSAAPRDLLIPMYHIYTGKITNIQSIRVFNEKSEKRFLPGGQLLEQCTYISDPISTDCFIITEGYKTGRAIDEINTSPLVAATVVCAFAANNVALVAKALRHKYPQALIFFAKDNDADSDKAGKKAREESGVIEIPAPNLFKGSDWADLAVAQGLAFMCDTLSTILIKVAQKVA